MMKDILGHQAKGKTFTKLDLKEATIKGGSKRAVKGKPSLIVR